MDTDVHEVPALHSDQVSEPYKAFLGIAGTMTLFAIVSVALRFVSRLQSLKCWWDDWAILTAVLFACGSLIMIALAATVGGAGYHVGEYNKQQLETYLQIRLICNIFYKASITISKLSILLLYHRIFSVEPWFNRALQVLGIILLGYFLASSIGLVFSYRPIEGQWKLWVPSTSIHSKAFWLAMGILNVVLDVIILALPQASVWTMQLSVTRKILVSLVFLLGGFVCITSIIRVISLLSIDIEDLTYTSTTPGIWTLVEMDTSIICACLPTFPSLLRASSRHRKSSNRKITWNVVFTRNPHT